MNKEQLIADLYDWKNFAIYNTFAQQCLHEYFKLLNKTKVFPYELPGVKLENNTVVKLHDFIKNNPNKKLLSFKHGSEELVISDWIKKSFRRTQKYCQETNQNKVFESTNWYKVARIIVNGLSHNHSYNLKNNNGNYYPYLPIEYKKCGYIIDQGKHNKKIDIYDMQLVLYDICEEILKFAQNEID